MKFSLIVPVYNEALSIEQLIKDSLTLFRRKKYTFEILIVDDASKDKTVEKVQPWLKNKEVVLIKHPYNKGVGAARKTGILHAKYDNIVMIDGDSTYPVSAIPEMLKKLEKTDLVIGARKKEKGTFKLLRTPIKWMIRKLAEFITGSKIVDLNSGLRAFRKSDILKFFNILPNTHSWVSTQVICYSSNYYSIDYMPIDYFKRKGKSTFHPLVDTYNYVSLIFRTILYFAPLKIFLPISFGLMIWGGIRALLHGLAQHIITSDVIIIFVGGFILVIGLLADIIIKSSKNQYFKWH